MCKKRRKSLKKRIDYYPFGALVPNRHSSSNQYRYGFNGFEKDDELKGEGNHISFGDYGYDTRLGRRFQSDPVFNASISPYAVFNNNPNYFIDPDGESPISILAKQALKQGIKKAAKELVEKAIKNRLKAYMSKGWAKQLAGDALDAIDLATTQAWWEYAIEVVPVVGDIYGGAVLTKQGMKVYKLVQRLEGRFEAIAKGLKGGSAKLNKALGGVVGDMLDAHHLIPEKLLKSNDVVQDAVAAGFDFTGKKNGLLVPEKLHGSHGKYTKSLENKINEWKKDNIDYTPEQAKGFIESLASDAKKAIEKNAGNVNSTIVR